jgi:hypothetical protein
MKTILILILCFPAALAQQVEYNVSKGGADKEKLEKVFEAVRVLEEPPAARGEEYEVSWKVSPTEYVVFKRVAFRDPVYADRLSSIGGSMGRDPIITYTMRTKTDVSYLLKLKEPMEKADGEIIAGISTQTTEATKTVDGITCRIIEQQDAPQAVAFTKEKFVTMLKAGQTWTLKGFEGNPCHRCLGDGKLSASEKEARCPDCKGKGSAKVDCLVKW